MMDRGWTRTDRNFTAVFIGNPRSDFFTVFLRVLVTGTSRRADRDDERRARQPS